MVRSLVTISTLCAGVLARRNEEATGFVQIKEMKSDLSQISYLQDVKNSLKKMAFNRANVPEEAIAAIDAITSQLGQILPTLMTEKNNDVIDEGNVMQQFDDAHVAYSGAIGIADGSDAESVSSVSAAAKETHTYCRVDESDEWTLHNTCDGQQITLQGTYDNKISGVEGAQNAASPTTCDPTSDTIYAFGEHNVAAVQNYWDAIDRLQSASSLLDAKKAECSDHLEDLNNQRFACDGQQHEYENAACNYASAYHSATNTYTGAYGIASGAYDADVGRWTSNSDNRFEQCKLVKKVICYVAALKEHDEGDALTGAIDTCDDVSHDDACADYQFDPRSKPDQEALVTTPATHCEGGFDYGAFAVNTVKGTASSCCAVR